jgi:hypothetical protein
MAAEKEVAHSPTRGLDISPCAGHDEAVKLCRYFGCLEIRPCRLNPIKNAMSQEPAL